MFTKIIAFVALYIHSLGRQTNLSIVNDTNDVLLHLSHFPSLCDAYTCRCCSSA
uniref:Uncharacterized protein n=1 Tax=Anguilla anguilla TaxID=7936 RepID=A0A0E9XT69_ANGAN